MGRGLSPEQRDILERLRQGIWVSPGHITDDRGRFCKQGERSSSDVRRDRVRAALQSRRLRSLQHRGLAQKKLYRVKLGDVRGYGPFYMHRYAWTLTEEGKRLLVNLGEHTVHHS